MTYVCSSHKTPSSGYTNEECSGEAHYAAGDQQVVSRGEIREEGREE
jgi:hypothetical protein